MSTQQQNEKQPNQSLEDDYSDYKSSLNSDEAVFADDDEREFMLEVITKNMDAGAIDQLTNVLIALITEIQKEPFGAQHVENELGLILELVFKRSTSYRLAFELYASRFDIGGKVLVDGYDFEQILHQIKAAMLKRRPTCTIENPRRARQYRSVPPIAERRAGWAQRFGATVADLLNDEKRTHISHDRLAEAVLEFVDRYSNEGDTHARILLPLALENLFKDVQPNLALYLTPPMGNNSPEQLLITVSEGDLSKRFKELVIGIDDLAFQAEEIASIPSTATHQDHTKSYWVEFVLQRGDGQRFEIYQRPIIRSALNPLFEYLEIDPLPTEPGDSANEQTSPERKENPHD